MGYRTESYDGEPSPVLGLSVAVSLLGLAAAVVLWLVLKPEARNDINFIAGAWGLVVGLGGFALTLWQLSITQTAAQQAKFAVERLRNDVKSLDILSEIHSANAEIANALSLLREMDWERASMSYEGLRSSLNKVTVLHTRIGGFDEATAKDYISHLIGAAGELDLLKDGDQFDTATMRARLREIRDFLVATEASIRDRIGEH